MKIYNCRGEWDENNDEEQTKAKNIILFVNGRNCLVGGCVRRRLLGYGLISAKCNRNFLSFPFHPCHRSFFYFIHQVPHNLCLCFVHLLFFCVGRNGRSPCLLFRFLGHRKFLRKTVSCGWTNILDSLLLKICNTEFYYTLDR